MASSSSSYLDMWAGHCSDAPSSRKRRRRRNKHVNPQSSRNVVKPLPKCTFRQPSLIDPDCWVVLVRLAEEEALHDFDEKLPDIAPKAGIQEAILRSHGLLRLIYVAEESDKKARDLTKLLEPYSAVLVGRTHKPFVRERTIEVHGVPAGIGYDELTEALDCQFPGKSLSFDVLITEDPRREPEREVLIVSHDASMCHQLLNNGGLKLFDDRLTFSCTERSSGAAVAASKWKKKKAKVVPESERQCFKCLEFGHMAEACERPPRCKRCAGPHAHRECPGAAVERVVCVNCGAVGHRAVSKSCPMRPGCAHKRREEREIPTLDGQVTSGTEHNGSAPSSPSPSPSDTGADDSVGAASSCALQDTKDEGEPLPSSPNRETAPAAQHTDAEARSEDDAEDVDECVAEASTEEPRDSPDMASSAAPTASPQDDPAPPDFTPSGVSSTTGEVKSDAGESTVQTEQPAETHAVVKEEVEEKNDDEEKPDETEKAEGDVNSSNIEEAEEEEKEVEEVENKRPEAKVVTDDSEEEHPDENVLYFTAKTEGDGDAAHPPCKTATAVAGFFSDLFGAAEAPSKPLDGRFVATLRSLQESVYADIVSRHPRRSPSSPRERKPAKKRRLLASLNAAGREAETQTAPAAAAPPSPKSLGANLYRLRAAAAVDGADKASRALSERRLRVLEQFLNVVGAILEL